MTILQENPTSGAFEKLAEEVEVKIVARAIEAGFKEQVSFSLPFLSETCKKLHNMCIRNKAIP